MEAALFDPRRFVFVDECGVHLGLTPRYARAPRGERAYGVAPRNTGSNTTLLAALSLAGAGAAMTLDGAADGRAVEAYVRACLAPTPVPGQIVVLDNLGAHKGAAIRSGRRLPAALPARLLRPTSPRSSTPSRSSSAAARRRAGARTREALAAALAGTGGDHRPGYRRLVPPLRLPG